MRTFLAPALSAAVAMTLCGCGYKTLSQRQRERARDYAPTRIAKDTPARPSPKAQKIRVRIYVDDDYQSLLQWRQRIDHAFETASGILAVSFGAQLEQAQLEPWSRDLKTKDLVSILDSLQAHDAGDDVDLVLGFVSPEALVTSDIHELGIARVMGRHAVVRGMDDRAELDAFRNAFDHLSSGELMGLYRQRRRHKAAIVLLHELGHTLGAVHVRERDCVMNYSWSEGQSRFSLDNAELIRRGLVYLDARKKDPKKEALFAKWASDAHGLLAKSTFDGWDQKARDVALDRYANPDKLKWDPVQAKLRKAMQAAFRHLQQKDPEGALGELEPFAGDGKEDPAFNSLACSTAAKTERMKSKAVPYCRRAMALDREDPVPALEVARILPQTSTTTHSALNEAWGRLLAKKKVDRKTWHWAAQIFANRHMIRRSLEAARRTLDPKLLDGLKERERSVRQTRVLPTSYAIDEADEGRYIQAAAPAFEHAYGGRHEKALAAASRLEKLFAKAPAGPAIRCVSYYNAKKFGPSKKACKTAIDGDAGLIVPRFLLALLKQVDRKPDEAIAELEALTVQASWYDPPWTSLAKAYGRSKKTAELEALRQRYKAERGEAPKW